MTYENSTNTDHLIKTADSKNGQQSARAHLLEEIYGDQDPIENNPYSNPCSPKVDIQKSLMQWKAPSSDSPKLRANSRLIPYDGPSSIDFSQITNDSAGHFAKKPNN